MDIAFKHQIITEIMTTLEYYMWGYQQHFRIACQVHAEFHMSCILQDPSPSVHLVGLRVPNPDLNLPFHHPICVDPPPDDEGLPLPILQGVDDLAEQFFAEDPGSKVFYSHGPISEQKHLSLRDATKGRAICRNIMEWSNSVFAYSSRSCRIGNYDVFVILLIPKRALQGIPEFAIDRTQYHAVAKIESLFVGIREIFMESIWHSMLLGRELASTVVGPTPDEAAARAGSRLVSTAVDLHARISAAWHTLFPNLNTLSQQEYESEEAQGYLQLVDERKVEVEYSLKLITPVRMSSVRAVAKLLRMTSDRCLIVTNGEDIFGLGSVHGDAQRLVFRIENKGIWSMHLGSIEMMRVQFGIPSLPRAAVTYERVAELMRREMNVSDTPTIDRVWSTIRAVILEKRGATVVLSRDAVEEARRLAIRSFAVEPRFVSSEFVGAALLVDGALLLDLEGRCHGVGVILDGKAGVNGNSARGGRYNSAVTYQEENPGRCVIVVISEDGMIDVIPDLLPTISRAKMDEHLSALRNLRSAAKLTPDDVIVYNSVLEWLRQHRQYISEAEAEELNTITKELDRRLREADPEREIWIVAPTFSQSPRYRPDALI